MHAKGVARVAVWLIEVTDLHGQVGLELKISAFGALGFGF